MSGAEYTLDIASNAGASFIQKLYCSVPEDGRCWVSLRSITEWGVREEGEKCEEWSKLPGVQLRKCCEVRKSRHSESEGRVSKCCIRIYMPLRILVRLLKKFRSMCPNWKSKSTDNFLRFCSCIHPFYGHS